MDTTTILTQGANTTVKSANYAYDRIILNDLSETDYSDNGIHRNDITKGVSDHYLIWVKLEI